MNPETLLTVINLMVGAASSKDLTSDSKELCNIILYKSIAILEKQISMLYTREVANIQI